MTVTRRLSLILAAALITLCTLAYAGSASAVSLKSHTVIEGDAITLGDLFDGLPPGENGADKVLGPAPQPGDEMTLSARTLLRVAIALELPWRPASVADYIVLTRAATVVGSDTIEQALRRSLNEQGVAGRYNVVIPNNQAKIILPPGEMASADVETLSVQRDKNTFEAVLVAPSKDRPLKKLHIGGAIESLTAIPVLNEPVGKGMIIGKSDIRMIEVPQKTLSADVIISADTLIGTTPRRLLSAGQPVKQHEVEAPRIVERGEFVTMVFSNGPLQLTARGKALQDGAKGDIVRVVNTGSNQTVEGIVTASKEVTVQTY